MTGDEPLVFLEELPINDLLPPWEILVADDDEGVHALTRLIFRNFTFEGRPLRFHDVYSGQDARAFLSACPGVALALLDVVMEEADTGLQVVRYLRDNLKNSFTRIILRTGQPGFAPEEKIIVEYDIHDYKEKSELTRQKLFTAVVTALRSYRDIQQIRTGRTELRKVVQASATLFRLRNLPEFCGAVLHQLMYLVNLGSGGKVPANGWVATFDEGKSMVRAGVGTYSQTVGRAVEDVVDPELFTDVQAVLAGKASQYRNNRFIAYFEAGTLLRTVVCTESSGPVEPAVLDLIRIFNFDVGIGLTNLFLNLEVAETQRELIFRLGELAESRSKEPGCHVRRVGGYAAILFEELGYSPEETESLGLAAAMHDIGKIGIPDRILTKPDHLDDGEFAAMKTHTTIGWELLRTSPLPIFQQAAEVARSHHERWDGQGYPRGLRAEEIPLSARVTAVVEVFDALTSKRDYHHPWDDEKALGHIWDGAGNAFDPGVVALFFKVKDKILRFRAVSQVPEPLFRKAPVPLVDMWVFPRLLSFT